MSLKYLFGRCRSLPLVPLVLSSLLLTAGCGGPLSLLTGGGPNVAANVQAGKTNTQTVGQTQNIIPTVSLRPNARVERIDQSVTEQRNDNVETQVINQTPVWLVLSLLLAVAVGVVGWMSPQPKRFLNGNEKELKH